MRFDVLVREGMHQQATGILIATARESPQTAHEALRKGLEGLGQALVTQSAEQPNGRFLFVWIFLLSQHNCER